MFYSTGFDVVISRGKKLASRSKSYQLALIRSDNGQIWEERARL
jgi:hypothetical protein